MWGYNQHLCESPYYDSPHKKNTTSQLIYSEHWAVLVVVQALNKPVSNSVLP